MVNMKLRGRMAEAGIAQRMLAERIGMSENTLSAKIRGVRPFKANEISAICAALHIDDPREMNEIFLAKSSRK